MTKMIRIGKSRGRVIAAACLWALGCGGGGSGGVGDSGGTGGGGALDGTWTWVSWTCNGTAMSMVPITATFSGSSGELANTLSVAPSCSMTTCCTVSYPSAGSFTWTMSSAPTCDPANCIPSMCNSPASNHVFAGTYTIQGNQATLTIPQAPADDAGCASGLEVITMQK